MRMELIPDDMQYIDTFKKIIVMPYPIFTKMCNSGDIRGKGPIGPSDINQWDWEYILVE